MALHFAANPKSNAGKGLRLEGIESQREIDKVGLRWHVDRAELFLKRTNTNFSNFIDSKLMLEHMLGAERLPLTLLIDAQGRVLAKFYGAKDWDSPEALGVISKAFGTKL